MSGKDEPWAAHLHGFARAIRPQQEALVAWRRREFERAPHWVLLTTRGRKTGLPREMLLPCARRRSPAARCGRWSCPGCAAGSRRARSS